MTIDAWEREYAKPDPVWKGPPLGASPFPAGLNILELGCGNGKNLPALLATAAAVTAVDFSHKALQLCREHFTDEKLSLLQADVCELPLADGQFTAVSAIHILEHLLAAERLKAAKEINRLLSPDGLLFVRVFATADMRYGKGSEVEQNTFVRGNGINYHYFTKEELVQLFSSLKLINYEELKVEKKYGCRCELSALFSKA